MGESTARFSFTKNGCNQNFSATWTPSSNATSYSMGLSKTKYADPGPLADTSSGSYRFNAVKPGKWYLNVKAGNSCGWGQIYTWDVDVPYPQPSLSVTEEVVTEEERKLVYSSDCANSVKIFPSVGAVVAPAGTVKIYPKAPTVYKVTAKYGDQETSRSITIQYPFPTPTPTPAPTITTAVLITQDDLKIEQISSNNNGNLWGFFKNKIWELIQ